MSVKGAETPVLTPIKRGGGRPKGLAKTGGRKKGSPNRTHIMTAAQIAKVADPLGLLCQIARGCRLSAAPLPGEHKRSWVYPDLNQMQAAATTLAKKVLPDVRAVEHSGPAGDNLVIKIVRYGGSNAS